MEDFLNFLSENTIASIIVFSTFVIVVLMFILAFIQNREVNFWPPSIGPKPDREPRRIVRRVNHKREINVIGLPPDTYSFDYLKKVVRYRFGNDAGFIVIQYGSSVKNPVLANDEDYIVLVHGNFYHDETKIDDIGHWLRPNTFLAKPIDIQIRLYDSFLIGLIMGKPYEVSVAIDGIVKDNHQIPTEYWGWLQTIVSNIMISTDYVIGRIKYDLQDYREQYIKSRKTQHPFNFIIAAYNYISGFVQINTLQKFPDHIPASMIYPLSQSNFLVDQIKLNEAKGLYIELVEYFKRNKLPPNIREFEKNVDRLLVLLNGETKDVQ